MLGIRQWRHVAFCHGAFCVSRQHRLCHRFSCLSCIIHEMLLCLFIVCETMFTIGESRTISHANDRQTQQVAPDPCPGRFSAETPLEREHRLQIQREHRRRRRQQETAEERKSLSTAKATPTTRDRETDVQETGISKALWSFYTVENPNLLVFRFNFPADI